MARREDAQGEQIAFQLRLQLAEIGIGLELGIVLGYRQEAREGARQLALRRLELPERLLIVEQFRRRLNAAHPRPCLGYLSQDVLFMCGIALDHIDQVGHQIGSALILVDHLGPGRLDLLVLLLKCVVAAAGQEVKRKKQESEEE